MSSFIGTAVFLSLLLAGSLQSTSGERFESFDKDPGWEGINNRSRQPRQRTVKQDFGYQATTHFGGQPGEIGGFVSTAAEPAYYAKRIPTKTLSDSLTASGRLIYTGKGPHLLLGFFNADTINEWRTPNSLSIRVQGRGEVFYAYVEYCTSKWRAGGDSPGGFAIVPDAKSGKKQLKGFRIGQVYSWSMKYDPAGNQGCGSMSVTIDGETSVCHLSNGHKSDGATFNRFGMLAVSKSADGGGEVWLDEITINGKKENFSVDPGWDAAGNRRTYETSNVRPWFDFGYSPTHHAQGKAPGELGGLVFRGDCRYADRMAAYGDRLEQLDLTRPLKASGRVVLRRGVTDSTTLLGYYHSKDSLEVNKSQASGIPRSFLGIAIEGPSREGFLLYPIYRLHGDQQGYAKGDDRPHILPDGRVHDWSLVYQPGSEGKSARVIVKLDGHPVHLDLKPDQTRFDRFGLITTWIDGNGQQIYFDDLRYTASQGVR